MIFNRYPALIAEVAGNFRTAQEAVELSKQCIEKGAEIEKFQTYQPTLLTSNTAIFDMPNTGRKSQKEVFEESVIDFGMQAEIFQELKNLSIPFFSTPSHVSDLEFLLKHDVTMIKLGSDDCSNLPFLRVCCETDLPIIVSTGMAHLHEIEEMSNILINAKERAILHCVTNYPAALNEMNLRTVSTLKTSFPEFEIGFSDHSNSTLVACLARALGATIFENHVMFDDQEFGYDRDVSMPISKVEEFIQALNDTEEALGSHCKALSKAEHVNRLNNRKSLHFSKDLKAGMQLTENDIIALRPGLGISPARTAEIVGQTINQDVENGGLIEWHMLS